MDKGDVAVLFKFVIYIFITLLALLILCSLYFKWYFSWELRNRRGLNYYGKPLTERRAFKRKIKTHAIFLKPFIFLEAKLRRLKKNQDIASIEYKGVYGPSYSCSQESFQKASEYKPTEKDIFVVTQMRCGTTWMQQIIYQILTKGNGEFDDNDHLHLYAISPWIEALDSVSIENAPLIGLSSRRLIKTHMPISLCPYTEDSKYVYVARHPISCFRSIVDYFRLTAGPFAPPDSEIADWFCSDRMWWLSWPEHIDGWWEFAQKKRNILFLHFEEMKNDIGDIIHRVSEFLGETLREDEIQRIIYKTSFEYMKKNEEFFEMVPPNLFTVNGSYFTSGKLDRYKDVSEENRKKILNFCKKRLANSSYPIEKFYPDIAKVN